MLLGLHTLALTGVQLSKLDSIQRRTRTGESESESRTGGSFQSNVGSNIFFPRTFFHLVRLRACGAS